MGSLVRQRTERGFWFPLSDTLVRSVCGGSGRCFSSVCGGFESRQENPWGSIHKQWKLRNSNVRVRLKKVRYRIDLSWSRNGFRTLSSAYQACEENRTVRYAPSPTGELHLGGLRTALFNWLFTKQSVDGKFTVRIEDTDKSREVAGSSERIQKTLERFGIESDAPPVRQSSRKELHAEHAHRLIDAGGAYPCFCSEDRLSELRRLSRTGQNANGGSGLSYDRFCRSIPLSTARKRMESGEKYTVRLKVPLVGKSTAHDMIKGLFGIQVSALKSVFRQRLDQPIVCCSNNAVDDQILLKSDGFPTYHLASVVDDHYTGVTHVIRGEEWISSLPKHILLYELFGWKVPQFAHLPLLLNADGSKVSKRQKDFSVDQLMESGNYLESAVLNFVALLGWAPSRNGLDSVDDENASRLVFASKEDLLKEFDISNATSKGAIVDLNFLHWLNGMHIRALSMKSLISILRAQLDEKGFLHEATDEYMAQVINLVLSRVFVLPEISAYATHFLAFDLSSFASVRNSGEYPISDLSLAKGSEIVSVVYSKLEGIPETDWDEKTIRVAISKAREELKSADFSLSSKHIMLHVRWMITASLQGPEFPLVMKLLGRNRVLERLGLHR